ncbi:hypothetical protein NEF87_000255 [Candidatus Lokiarchaeum ossiferum]|uniref:Uncharacterized protein n=1 Tax=Candidatus Lokiarchaeum ossiferum TaxID=2951803 RepID=A0ABY6HKQ0_9ARCH|nr:hypothetical protein NEF87_000255 [Candidatus Lokiarchaeum sp. B-35]
MSAKIFYNLKKKIYVKAEEFPGDGFIKPILFEKNGEFFRKYKNKRGKTKVTKIKVRNQNLVDIQN